MDGENNGFHPIKTDDLGENPPFKETPIYIYIQYIFFLSRADHNPHPFGCSKVLAFEKERQMVL